MNIGEAIKAGLWIGYLLSPDRKSLVYSTDPKYLKMHKDWIDSKGDMKNWSSVAESKEHHEIFNQLRLSQR